MMRKLRSVERDLRSKYGNRFRVLRADSSLTALEILKQLKLRNEPPALFLVDQRMPQMTGVEFLEQAMNIFPDGKGMKQIGMGDWFIDIMMELFRIIRAGNGSETTDAVERITGRKPISFAQFAKDYAEVFR